MRLSLLIVPLVCLGLLVPSFAEDDAPAKGDALLQAATACPVTFSEAMERAYGAGRRPVRGELLLDTAGHLMMRAVVRVTEKEAVRFETWLGPVSVGGWIPARRDLDDPAAVEEAKRQWAVLEPHRNVLRKALGAAIRTDEQAGPADIALSVAPLAGEGRLALRVVDGGVLRGLVFDPASATFDMAAPEPEPTPVPVEVRTLPELEVPDGQWFNTEDTPTLAGWRGSPVLVVVTDPG